MVLQANKYGTNSQPYYVFLDHSEKLLIELMQIIKIMEQYLYLKIG